MRRNRNGESVGLVEHGIGGGGALAPRQVGQATGVRNHRFLKAYGLREIATGIGILQSPQPAKWMWGRVAGDVLDIATLSAVVADRSCHRGRALAAMTAVAGVTAPDAPCAAQLSAAAAMEG